MKGIKVGSRRLCYHRQRLYNQVDRAGWDERLAYDPEYHYLYLVLRSQGVGGMKELVTINMQTADLEALADALAGMIEQSKAVDLRRAEYQKKMSSGLTLT